MDEEKNAITCFNAAEREVVDDKADRSVDQASIGEKQLPSRASENLVSNEDVIVWWEEPENQDPENPMNWSEGRKWTNILIVSAMTVMDPLASSIFAPTVPIVMRNLHSNNEQLATFIISAYILGFAVGPLISGPMSEMYGRLPVYHLSNFFFVVFTALCGVSQNMGTLVAFRFLAGCFGVTPMTLGGSTIADLLPPSRRARAMSIWSVGPLLGPSLGAIAGGYLSVAAGWRWVFWTHAIVTAVIAMAGVIFMQETYATTILARKAAKLRKTTGNLGYKSRLDNGLKGRALVLSSLIRPAKMLLFAPPVTCLAIYMSYTYAVLCMLYTTFPYVFSNVYGFSSGTLGLTYIGAGVGIVSGLMLVGLTSDQLLKRAKAKGEAAPEIRLTPWLQVPGGLCMPLGLFIYGWALWGKTHWIVPMAGTLFVGLGLVIALTTITTYLIDVYTRYAASALAANTFLRSLLGALLPLATLDIYNNLGYGWGSCTLAFVNLALWPVPLLFYKYGKRIRENPKFQPTW